MTSSFSKLSKRGTVKGRYFFLTIPGLEGTDEEVEDLKESTFKAMVEAEQKYHLQHLGVVRQHHRDGSNHLHIFVQYERAVEMGLKHYDYLFKHPNVQRVKGLKHVLDYFVKEDVSPLFTKGFYPTYEVHKLIIEKAPYELLEKAMLQDPFHFEAHSWLHDNNLTVAASKGNWPKAINLVKKQQQVVACKALQQLPGFRKITRELIESNLSKQELLVYDSWEGYQVIVDHLNQIVKFGCNRPRGSTNLLIVSERAGIGKTSLFDDQNPKHYSIPISKLTSTYFMGMKHWFPKYESSVFKMILWNQMRLTAYSYDVILKLLEGFPVDLPYHGGSMKKTDNPLVVMTSNLTLLKHIAIKFSSKEDRQIAFRNLTRRVVEVVVPQHLDLFLLQKLIVSS